jgi:tRNA-splicing endonuclease subunit Sen54
VKAYAYLKRLGYTVQRAPQFIPEYFDPPRLQVAKSELPPFRPWWFSLPQWLGRLVSAFKRTIMVTVRGIGKVGLDLAFQRQPLRETLLSNWHGADYGMSLISSTYSLAKC